MIVSEKFMVNSDVGHMAAARIAADDFAWRIMLNRRDALRLDLLVEETLGMVKNMLDDFYGQFWFECDGSTVGIHFEATADMDADKKQDLLSVSSTGQNAAAKGFMAKLGEVVSNTLHGFGQSMDAYGEASIRYGIVHVPSGTMGSADMMPIWTLTAYRDNLDQARGDDDTAEAAWDELEKSIVARLADDVVVGVKGDRIDLIITKKF